MQYEYPSTRHSHEGYPYRVWIFSMVTSIILAACFTSLKIVLIYLAFFPLSLPAMVVYMLSYWRLSAANINPIGVKLLLAIIGISLFILESSLIAMLLFHEEPGPFMRDMGLLWFSCIFLITSVVLSLRKR